MPRNKTTETKKEQVVLGILISEAAVITQNAFRDVIALTDLQLAKLSPDDKFSKYCDHLRLEAILDYVRSDRRGGLPAMTPPRTIDPRGLSGISLGSAIRLLVRRLSDLAYYRK